MQKQSRRNFFAAMGTMAIASTTPALLAEPRRHAAAAPSGDSHVHDGIFYFFGTGANDGYPSSDQVTVSDPFEKHVTRTMEALKKTLEGHGCTMDSILHLEVFVCLPLADGIPTPAGKARFDAHQAQYEALNKIYHPYFSKGRAPSRACMAVEWIPGNSLIEIVGSALIVNTPEASAD
ncbi:MAG TPA: RidA family protein [Acidobacteriaceae bacterium]|jgi:enamine deaminase RidA (YjgF/YER057c/UK114 family)